MTCFQVCPNIIFICTHDMRNVRNHSCPNLPWIDPVLKLFLCKQHWARPLFQEVILGVDEASVGVVNGKYYSTAAHQGPCSGEQREFHTVTLRCPRTWERIQPLVLCQRKAMFPRLLTLPSARTKAKRFHVSLLLSGTLPCLFFVFKKEFSRRQACMRCYKSEYVNPFVHVAL